MWEDQRSCERHYSLMRGLACLLEAWPPSERPGLLVIGPASLWEARPPIKEATSPCRRRALPVRPGLPLRSPAYLIRPTVRMPGSQCFAFMGQTSLCEARIPMFCIYGPNLPVRPSPPLWCRLPCVRPSLTVRGQDSPWGRPRLSVRGPNVLWEAQLPFEGPGLSDKPGLPAKGLGSLIDTLLFK